MIFPDGKRIIPARQGSPREPRLRHRSSFSYVMSSSFANQTIARSGCSAKPRRVSGQQGLRAAEAPTARSSFVTGHPRFIWCSFPREHRDSLLIVWILNAVALMAVAYLMPSIKVTSFVSALLAAFSLGLVNTLIRPVLTFLTLPISVLTLGFFWC